jgi:hypothetical protein
MPLTNNSVKNGAFVKVGTPRCGVTARVQRAELTTPPVKITPDVATLNAARCPYPLLFVNDIIPKLHERILTPIMQPKPRLNAHAPSALIRIHLRSNRISPFLPYFIQPQAKF